MSLLLNATQDTFLSDQLGIKGKSHLEMET